MIISKPWGSEQLIESNNKYTMKKLTMLAGQKCSLQYHEIKHETFYVLTGILKFTYGSEINSLQSVEMKAGEFFIIPPGMIHRMEGVEDSTYLEASTSELNDVVRLEDSYGRI